MPKKKSFVMYHDFADVIDELSEQEAGELFKAIYHYQLTGEKKNVSIQLKFLFTNLVSQFIRDDASYKEVCASRSEAGRKGGLAKASKAKQKKQKLANLADSDSDSENGSVNDKKKTKAKKVSPYSENPPSFKEVMSKLGSIVEKEKLDLTSEIGSLIVKDYLAKRAESEWLKYNGKPVLSWKLDINAWITNKVLDGTIKIKKV